jgi:hypothetical protein
MTLKIEAIAMYRVRKYRQQSRYLYMGKGLGIGDWGLGSEEYGP